MIFKVFLPAFGIILGLFIFRMGLKMQPRKKSKTDDYIWSNEICQCGQLRQQWKVYGMDILNKTVLLGCPNCGCLWEEQMSEKGNRWRKIDSHYAQSHYSGYKGEII